MSTAEPSSADQGDRHPARLRWLLISQVGLFLIATMVFAYIGWRIKPLIQQQKELQEKLQGLNQQIDDRQEVLRKLNVVIKRSKDESLVREAGQIELLPLRGYKVGIHYLAGDKNAEARANSLLRLYKQHTPRQL
jgi:hypothetical protein